MAKNDMETHPAKKQKREFELQLCVSSMISTDVLGMIIQHYLQEDWDTLLSVAMTCKTLKVIVQRRVMECVTKWRIYNKKTGEPESISSMGNVYPYNTGVGIKMCEDIVSFTRHYEKEKRHEYFGFEHDMLREFYTKIIHWDLVLLPNLTPEKREQIMKLSEMDKSLMEEMETQREKLDTREFVLTMAKSNMEFQVPRKFLEWIASPKCCYCNTEVIPPLPKRGAIHYCCLSEKGLKDPKFICRDCFLDRTIHECEHAHYDSDDEDAVVGYEDEMFHGDYE